MIAVGPPKRHGTVTWEGARSSGGRGGWVINIFNFFKTSFLRPSKPLKVTPEGTKMQAKSDTKSTQNAASKKGPQQLSKTHNFGIPRPYSSRFPPARELDSALLSLLKNESKSDLNIDLKSTSNRSTNDQHNALKNMFEKTTQHVRNNSPRGYQNEPKIFQKRIPRPPPSPSWFLGGCQGAPGTPK